MKKLAETLIKHLNELVLLGGVAAMTAGAGMIYPPAGLLLGGGLAIVGAVLSMWGDEKGDGEG